MRLAAQGSVSVRCPDCGASVGPVTKDDTCRACRRRFALEAGVWDLRPGALTDAKLNEDRASGTNAPAWRRLTQKAHWIEWFETRCAPRLVRPGTRTFLELGGGLCYASALAKRDLADGYVVATDISARYLRRDAVRVGQIIGTPADLYAAADAETIPFDDGQFDAVYSQVVLYRLADPARALREIHRVLTPGGLYLGVERASPWLWDTDGGDRRILARAARDGTLERPVTFAAWRQLLQSTGVPGASIRIVPGRRLRARWLRHAAGAVRPVYVTIEMRK
jgi:ubiquinone/menaquinone biosynthesis C-methylase UbiE